MIHTKFDGYTPDGTRRLYKGGGGGSSNYANLDTLYKEQADSARLLREQAEANLPSAVNSYVAETNEVLDPGYVEKKAGMAATDMASANAQERAATERSLTAMGVNPNDARFAGSAKATEVSNAARLAAGKNVARTEANNYQLNVAKDAVGTFTGQSNNAATQLGSAASGLGSLAASQSNQQLAQQQAQSNNVGNAVGAGIAAYGIYNQPTTKKDGGRIKLPAGLKKVECHAMGGGVGGNQGFFQMQSIAPPPVAQAPQQGGSPVGSALGTANMIRGLYNAGAKKTGDTAVKKGGEAIAQKAASQKAGEVATAKAGEQAGVIATDTATAGATDAAAAAAAKSATTAAATEATTAAATTAATDAAVTAAVPAAVETAAGSGLMAGLGTAGAAIGTAMPWVGAAMVAGSLLDLWNAGGEVGTQNEGMSEAEAAARFAKADQNGTIQDIRKGGKVPGEWKGNTDNVPALLTEDEHVINAEAAAMVGHDKLEQLNKQGLALRKQGYTPGRIKAAGGIQRRAA
jgi:hypothetical protein